MPMCFPTHQSVVNRAQMRNFRAPMKEESEENYRNAFAKFMRFVDPVEASEISSGLGWDRQSPLRVLAGSLGVGGVRTDPGRMYTCVVTGFPLEELSALPESIVRGLRIGKTEVGKLNFEHDFYHGRDQERRYSDYYDPTDEAPALTKPEIKGTQIRIAVNPKELEYDEDRIFIGGNLLRLFNVNNFVLFGGDGDQTEVNNQAFVIMNYTFEQPYIQV